MMKSLISKSPPFRSGNPGFFRDAGWLTKVAAILLVLMSFLPKESLATHFRYGNISWTWVNGKTVTFHVSQSWRRTFFPGPPNVGNVITGSNLDFGDGSGQVPINITVTTVNTTQDWVYGEATITHTYANNGTYTALFANCCRISTLQNNHDQNFQVETIVNLGSGISSPVSSMPPLIAVQTGLAPAVFQLAASDPNGLPLTYRLATPLEMGGAALVQPTGISINPTTGLVSFNTVGKPVGDLYNASFVVSDGLASIWVDVLLNIVAQSTPPQFDYSVTPANGFHYDIQPGQNVNFNVKALDLLSTDLVTLQAIGLPAGAVLTPVLPITGNPVQTHFNWTPTIADLGSRIVNFVATDENGVQTSTDVTITVSMDPVFDAPTPADNSTRCLQGGQAFSETITAHAPDPTVKLQITAVTDGFPGATHTPAIPTPLANSSSTVLTGIATGFGVKHFSATATDNLGHSTTTSWDYFVDIPPAFTSSPSVTTITQNQPFSYAVIIADPDIILGDTVEIDGIIIPSWMTFTQTGPTTGLLSGNPGMANVGTFHVQLNTSDLFEHCYGPVIQSFDVVVNACTFAESILASPSATNNCPGTSVVLTAASANSYSWSTGDTTQTITVVAGPNTTYTVTAVSGFCSSVARLNVQGVDTIPPTAICQNITVSLDAMGNVSITAAQVNNGSSDACGIASMTVSPNTFSCANVGANTVTLKVTDVNGNVSTCTSTVNVQDLIAPSVICQNITANLDATGNASITAAQVNNGSSDACGIASMSVSPNTFTCANVGPNAVTLTVTDVNGNASTCSSTVTILDVTAPTAVCQNISVNLDASGNASITAAQINNGSSDACGIKSMSVAPSAFTCANIGPNAVTLTVTDVNGNVSTCSSTVTILDVTAPTAVCQNISVNLDASGNASITAAQINNGSSDACGIKSMSVAPSAFTCANVGPNAVTLTVTDMNENVSTCTSTVTVKDLSGPIPACKNISVPLSSTGFANITAAQINNGSSAVCGIQSLSVSPNTFTCANVGANNVLLTVTGVNGNSNSCLATVTVLDITPPTALCKNISVNLDATGNASISPAQVNNGSFDGCGIRTLTVSPNTFTCANVGPNAVTLTVTDVNGNVSTCSSTVTILDVTAPTAVCQNISVNLDATGNASITPAQINNGSSDACGIKSMTVAPNKFTCNNAGPNTVTLTLTDNSGNTSTCTSTVTVTDNIAPVAICHNATVSLDATGHATVLASQINNGSSDNCGIVSMSVVPNSFTCANYGANPVTLTVTDAHGNSSSCTATVTVQDNTPPVASCHNATIYLDATGHAVLTAAQINNGSSDNCGIASVTVSPSAFTCANVGTNPVTLTVTDVHGNISTCTASVSVLDNTAPVVSCKNVTVTLVNGAASITAAQVTNSSSDNCGIASMKVSPSTFTCANIGANTVTLTATDTHGNSSTCQAVVTVVGKAPSCTIVASHSCDDNVFTGGDPTHIYLGYGPQSVILNVTATGGTTFTYSWSGTGLSSTTCANPVFKPTAAGMYTLTVTSTNNYGCSTTCSITICVLDVRVPKSCNMVYLCHVPPGKPSNPQTLSISTSAVDAHLKNHVGDHLGQCNQVCGTTKEEMADATIIDEMGDLAVLAYPNPFSEGFHVRIESASNESITIRLFSITGQLMEAHEHVSSDKDLTLGNNIPNGLYFLEVQQGESKKVVKVQKAE
jgi:hypothetical protein